MSGTPKEPLIPWHLLFSRTGLRRGDTAEEETKLLTEVKPRSMTEKEGRGAFFFWLAFGFVLCLLTAICAVSCGRGDGTESGLSFSALCTVILILAAVAILAVAAADFLKAWKAQSKKTADKSPIKKRRSGNTRSPSLHKKEHH